MNLSRLFDRSIATGLSLIVAPLLMAAAPIGSLLDGPVRLTEADVARSNAKLESAYGALIGMWTAEFRGIDRRFYAPRLVRYRGAVRTECGVAQSNNAMYCVPANTIYYDEVFVAAQGKVTGVRLRTDGDMAGIGIVAHEVGHAVAMQLGEVSRVSYNNEAKADCLAGAFARYAGSAGSLEEGDLEEAFDGMAAAGDPVMVPTGDARTDRRMQSRIQRSAHGTAEQRTSNFDAGLRSGSKACLAAFRA